ncbi:hypothetical protein NQ314_007694 [Rhamnusium bicolor]|uniref:Elongin-A n=1 Tax=Rhamnusium bicolor TaxID=1586634 RepID=A0AAV8YJL5_9CUCU|nr:hypothetical protein NQ314_007694 [Rhamnusium bicolor]
MVIKEEERITENAVNESISVPCPPTENDFSSYGKQENSCTEEGGQYRKKESSSSHKASDTEIKSSEKCETDKRKKYSKNSSSRSLQEKEHKWSSNKERRQESDSSSDAHSSRKHYNSNSGFESEEVYESKHSKSEKKERNRKSRVIIVNSKHESKKSYESSSDKDVKHKSKRESKSRHDKESSSKSNKSRSHSSRSDKHEKNDKEESKIEESKGKHSHKNDEPRKHEEKFKKSMDERKSNRKEKSSSSHRPEGSKISSSSSNHRSSSGIKSKDNVKVVMPVNTKEIINGIDSGSGVSFAEALLIFDPLDSKSSTSNKENTSSILSTEKPKSSSSYVKPDNTKIVEEDDVPSLLKEQPPKSLNQNICGLLSEITSNYKPVGFQVDMQPKKMLTQDEALGQVISKRNMRTKVYSGIKSHGRVETLFDLSLRVLQDNIDALAYTVGVPDSLIIPVLEKATADQLFNMERHHPHMIEQTDALWLMHCQKEFRNEKREASESWREMYVRCLDEREAKLSAITANIKQSQDKSIPIRTTKLAYIDSVVKPPRNIARKQAKNGILFDKKPAQTPASRFAASALSGGVKKMVTPNPENRAVKRSSEYLLKAVN